MNFFLLRGITNILGFRWDLLLSTQLVYHDVSVKLITDFQLSDKLFYSRQCWFQKLADCAD